MTQDTGLTLLVGGTLAIQDLDLIDTHTAAAVFKSSTSDAHLPGFSDGTALGSFTIDPSVTEFGNDTDNGATLGWHFSLDNSNATLQSLAQGQSITEVYTVTFTDSHGATVAQDVTVTINGANDAPTVTSTEAAARGTVTEDAGTTLSINGTLAIQDLDLVDTHTAAAVFKSSTSDAHLPGFGDGTALGSFTIDPSVTEFGNDTDNGATLGWHFSLDNSNATLQSLAQGQSITEVYTVTFTDNHGATVAQDVTVTINGSNDAPTITSDAAAATGSVTEDAATPTLSTGGTLAIQDFDLIDTHTATAAFKASSVNSALSGFGANSHIGTFTIDTSVTELGSTDSGATLGWHFTIDDSNPTLQSLASGQTITQVYTVTFADNHGATVAQDVTVTITGTNDSPTLADATLASVAGNDGNPAGSSLNDIFANKFSDVDTGSSLTAIAVTSDTASATEGVWQYELAGTHQWVDIGSVGDTHALVLSPDTLIRFVPANGFTGTPDPLGVHALDDTYIGAITDASSTAVIDITSMSTNDTAPVSHDITTISTSVTAPAGGPVIDTENFYIWHNNESNTETIMGLSVSGSPTETYTLNAFTTGSVVGSSVSPSYDHGLTLDQLNAEIAEGTYDPGATPPVNERVVFSVADSTGASDTVNFIFNEAGSGPVYLLGTPGKDVLFGTGSNDTLDGNGGHDQFVFGPASGTVQHTILEFDPTLDKIDLRQFGNIESFNDLVRTQQAGDTLITLDSHEAILLKNVAVGNLQASDFIFGSSHIT